MTSWTVLNPTHRISTRQRTPRMDACGFRTDKSCRWWTRRGCRERRRLRRRTSNPSSSTEGNYRRPEILELGPQPRDLQIDYTSPTFTVPQKVKFRYRLDSYDSDWHDAGTRRQAFYTDLPPGNYTFRVIAANSDGVWNETPAKLDFSIAPAYFQTNWFRALCACPLPGNVVDRLPVACPALAAAVRDDAARRGKAAGKGRCAGDGAHGACSRVAPDDAGRADHLGRPRGEPAPGCDGRERRGVRALAWQRTRPP